MKSIRYTCIVLMTLLAAMRGWAVTPAHCRAATRGHGCAVPYSAVVQRSIDDDLAGTWYNHFDPPGPNGTVLAVAMLGGDLYIGGDFTAIGNVPARHIARWDGHAWHSLGQESSNGVSRMVTALLADGDSLYVGGQFDQAGSLVVNNLAVWHPLSQSWSGIGSGITGEGTALISCMLKYGGNLYVGGRFTATSTIIANNIARWDGARWSRLGSGVAGVVYTLSRDGDNLYVGGTFTSVGGKPARNVACWNISLDSWGPLGAGAEGPVYSLAVRHDSVYVGGHFLKAGSAVCQNLAIWDRAVGAWYPFPQKIMFPPVKSSLDTEPAFVYQMIVDGPYLYIAGAYRSGVKLVGSWYDTLRSLARWNLERGSWESLNRSFVEYGNGFPEVRSIALADGMLYAAGKFPIAGMYEAVNVAACSLADTRWRSLGASVDGTSGRYQLDTVTPYREPYGLRALASGNDGVYVGGYFASAGGMPVRNVALWSGSAWQQLADGVGNGIGDTLEYMLPEHVGAIAVRGTDVIVGGVFDTIGTSPARNIALWNGSAWSTLGPSIGDGFSRVDAIAVAGSEIFAAGEFGAAGAAQQTCLARWNGSGWTRIGMPFDSGSTIHVLLARGDDLYIGGDFHTANGLPVAGLVRLNIPTQQWSGLGSGVEGAVWALTFDGNRLYVGGELTSAGGVPVSRVAAWDDGSWNALGDGIGGGIVRALAVVDGYLYAGGDFRLDDGAIANYLAAWNGELWRQVGGGLDYRVTALAGLGKDLYVCGDFTLVGLAASDVTSAHYFARWTRADVAAVHDVAVAVAGESGASVVAVTPNPVAGSASITFSLPHAGHATLALYDALGNEVSRIADGEFPAGASVVPWSAGGISSGTYLCRLVTPDGVATARLVLAR
jgi:hypothetical protein